ncbi:hypothetical protein PIB30_005067 [Stylosanthes scabra]|uniref:SKP1 component POZ domain-containing protein n=1 Tax=Stylosanthes scabra TaxID=79078 RepID=A0ABU6Z5W8_9FABA|nr:hypothetical protein [Stylosanthes scabra]
MGHYFISMTRSKSMLSEISIALMVGQIHGEFNKSSCAYFIDWLNRQDSYDTKIDDFDRLLKNRKVNQLCQTLYYDLRDYVNREDPYVSIKCSDGQILKIAKSLICAESEVVKDLLDSVDVNSGVIPLTNVSSDILLEIILFLKKKRDFQEITDKGAAHYRGWSKAFINRNRPILNGLHLAAEELQIKSLLDLTTQELQRHADEHLLQCFHYFSAMSGNNNRSREILKELDLSMSSGRFNDVACKDFKDWFAQIGDSGKNHLEEFKALMDPPDFRNVCYSIYRGDYRHEEEWDQFSLESSDGEVFDMVKSIGVDQSCF